MRDGHTMVSSAASPLRPCAARTRVITRNAPSMTPRFHALIPAAGNGFRYGGPMPKQYLRLHGRTVLHHVVARLARWLPLASINVVVSAHDRWIDDAVPASRDVTILRVGGSSRAETVCNGLHALTAAADDDWILVHDAVRPCIDGGSLRRLVQELAGDPVGGLLGVRVGDTLKRVDPVGRVTGSQARDGLWHAQTPQMFRCHVLRRAFAAPDLGAWTDEAQAVEALGEQPRMVEGSSTNLKITYPGDLQLAAAIMADEPLDEVGPDTVVADVAGPHATGPRTGA